MRVVGLYLVRNEVDIIETNLRHHFANVIDEALVIDNGSTDGTLQLLGRLAEELPIQLSSEVGPQYQADRTTRLAKLACLQGADWVLPIDADEFWVGTDGPFRDVLAETPADVPALFVDLVNFVQRRDVYVAEPSCLETMTMRPPEPVGTPEDAERLVTNGEIGWVEVKYTPKAVHRAAPDTLIPRGNHMTGVDGVSTDRLVCLHAGMRARAALTAKVDHGRRIAEERSPSGAGWHVKRWWHMARANTLGEEWEALSYEDGAITVGGRRRPLVEDDRLRDAARAVAPQVRTTREDAFAPTSEMEPTLGAYLQAMDEVPGTLEQLDFRAFVEIDRVQQAHGAGGDIFEIGTYMGRSAILFGYLARPPKERLSVCDVFDRLDTLDEESWPLVNHLYGDASEKKFAEHYQRFHDQLPQIMVEPSQMVDAKRRARTCRIVHVDGGHRHDVVRTDAATAKKLLRPGGIVSFGGLATPHTPGSALAAWELVLARGFVPICVTRTKLYGTWDVGGIDWAGAIDAWVAREPDLGAEVHTMAGKPVRRLYDMARYLENVGNLTAVPSLEDLDARLAAVAPASAATPAAPATAAAP